MKRVISLLLAAVLLIGASWTAQPAQAAGKKLIAITYDDGPGPYTDSLLDGLRARGVKATFFMLGSRVSSYSSTVARMYNEGHQLANHSYDHSDLTGLSAGGIQSQIQSANRQLDRTCGKGTSYLVRAPYGSVNSTVRSSVGAPLVLWSVDPQDWLYRNSETVKNNIIGSAHDGAIILVHDIHSTSIPGSLAAIDHLKKKGYEFVTVRELFRRRGKTLANGVQYGSCPNTGKDLGPVKAPEITTETENGRLKVTMKAQAGASIYYTTGSGTLNQESRKYNGPFLTDYPCKLRAVAAFNMNGSRSETVEKSFTMPRAEKPTMQISGGMLSIESATEGIGLYYTLTGATDSGGEQEYIGPAPIEPGTDITAYAAGEGYLNSEYERASYSQRGNLFYNADTDPGQWFYEDVDRAVAAGYIRGVGEGRFAPLGKVTRGQLVTFMYRYAGEPAGEGAGAGLPFTDVQPGRYYSEPAAWAYANGIVSGYGNNTFRPEKGVSRQEMAAVFYNFLCHKGIVSKDGPPAGEEYISVYKDAGKIEDWARGAVGFMSYAGLLQGSADGSFLPDAGTTRAQAAAVLMRLSDYVSGAGEPEPDPEPDPE